MRRKVLASADVQLQQVQVVDSKGQIRSVVVWRCGPDILYAETMDGLFDVSRRHTAPKWLVEQLVSLPSDRRFDAFGRMPGSAESGDAVAFPSRPSVPDGEGKDDDLPGFQQV